MISRSVVSLARRGLTRQTLGKSFATSSLRSKEAPVSESVGLPDVQAGSNKIKKFNEIKSEADLLPPGAAPGTVPTDLEQSTGLERLEILGKMQGVDIFDMRPLDASRRGTLEDPIVVRSAGDEQYCGCTGCPADSHVVIWLTTSRSRPVERCPECGSVYKMEYIGPEDDPHDHGHHGYVEPKTIGDYLEPKYQNWGANS